MSTHARTGIPQRLLVLERSRDEIAVYQEAHRLTAHLGSSADELIAEAIWLQHRFAMMGAFNRRDQLSILADDLGIPVSELEQDLVLSEHWEAL